MKRKIIFLVILLFCSAWSIMRDPFVLVNSSADELNPVVSPDGTTLYFTVANHPLNTGGSSDKGDIWLSRLVGESWGMPIHAGFVINDDGYNAVAGFSSDGKQLFLIGNYVSDNQTKRLGISVANQIGSNWSSPRNMAISGIANSQGIFMGRVSHDGGILVFSLDSRLSDNKEDIYVSTRSGLNAWSEPHNLGQTINTPAQEVSPWITKDLQRIYFSSNGHNGYGSFDVFYAIRLDGTWDHWSAPVNLGEEVNSSGSELYYSLMDDQEGLYVSTRSSEDYGNFKLHRLTVEEQIAIKAPHYMASANEEKEIVAVNEKMELINFKGKILDVNSNKPLVARLLLESDNQQYAVTSDPDGGFSIGQLHKGSYQITVEAPGYISDFTIYDASTINNQTENIVNFLLHPVALGAVVRLPHVLFKQSTAEILKESYNELEVFFRFMQNNPSIHIGLEGHTENRGSKANNLELSRARAEHIKAYLVDKGINKKRITAKGYGGTIPLYDNSTETTRRLNRRVSFKITKK